MNQLLNKIFQRSKHEDLNTNQMWFLDSDISSNEFNLPPPIYQALLDIKNNGVAILRNNNSDASCDSLLSEFKSYVSAAPESVQYCDEHGLHDRLCNLQLVSSAARDICFNKNTLATLSAAFRAQPLVVGSLFFERGSTQSIHRDTPAFFTNPLNHYFGVWNALEDIAEDSGPLIYYKGGHKIALDESILSKKIIKEKDYFAYVEGACKDAGLELVSFCPKKGDTLIWHPQLPHGGAPFRRPGTSRKSIVFHYIPNGVPIFGPKEFFAENPRLLARPNYKTISFNDHLMIDQGSPKFFHNKFEGNFKEID